MADQTVTVGCRLGPKEAALLEACALVEGTTRSEVLRSLIPQLRDRLIQFGKTDRSTTEFDPAA
jgi:hypothetical protein